MLELVCVLEPDDRAPQGMMEFSLLQSILQKVFGEKIVEKIALKDLVELTKVLTDVKEGLLLRLDKIDGPIKDRVVTPTRPSIPLPPEAFIVCRNRRTSSVL